MENRKKIKIVLATNDFIIGGVQKLIVDQLKFLDQNLFEFSVITLMQFPEAGNFYDLVPRNIPVYKFNFKNIYDFNQWIELYKILKKIKPDIVKTSLFFSNTVFRVLEPFLGYKIITAEHNTEIKKSKLKVLTNKVLSFLSYKIIVDSQGVADFLVEKEGIKKEKIAVIYNGIEIEEIKNTKKEFFDQKEKIRREMRLTLGHKIFLNIARINTQKNHRLMIEAFYDLCKKRGDCRLVIIGDGSLKNNIEKQIKELGLENKVLLLGERKDIYKFYSISDFFILTSMREGFCISAMNGLAFGLPLISTKVAGVSEYLKDGKNGFFADSDPKDISEKMDTMANLPHEELSKMKKNSEETAEEFDIKKYGEAYQKLFLACVGRA